MTHVYRIERIVEGVVVETIKPKNDGRDAALRETRERATKLGHGRAYGAPPMIRLLNITRRSAVVVTYQRGDRGLPVKV